jgi:hypothetical protein
MVRIETSAAAPSPGAACEGGMILSGIILIQ